MNTALLIGSLIIFIILGGYTEIKLRIEENNRLRYHALKELEKHDKMRFFDLAMRFGITKHSRGEKVLNSLKKDELMIYNPKPKPQMMLNEENDEYIVYYRHYSITQKGRQWLEQHHTTYG